MSGMIVGAKDGIWPNGVKTDCQNFLKLFDLTDKLPYRSSETCRHGNRSFLSLITNIPESLKNLKIGFQLFDEQKSRLLTDDYSRAHCCDRLHDVTAKQKKTVHYRGCQINGNGCVCRVSFGGDELFKNARLPVFADAYPSGTRFDNILFQTMKKNCEKHFRMSKTDSQPWWLRAGSLFNRYDLNKDEGIGWREDAALTYTEMDPIASFTYTHAGVLLIRQTFSRPLKKYHADEFKLLLVFQQPHDCLVMGGLFQTEFQHSVPPRHEWDEIGRTGMYHDTDTNRQFHVRYLSDKQQREFKEFLKKDKDVLPKPARENLIQSGGIGDTL